MYMQPGRLAVWAYIGFWTCQIAAKTAVWAGMALALMRSDPRASAGGAVASG